MGKLTVSGKSHCNKCNWIWIQAKDYVPVAEQVVKNPDKFGVWGAEKIKLAYKKQAYKKAIEFSPISDTHVSDLYPDKPKPNKYPLHCKLWLAGYVGDKVEECCKVCHNGSLDHSWGFRHTLNKMHGKAEYVVCCQVMKICLKEVSDVG